MASGNEGCIHPTDKSESELVSKPTPDGYRESPSLNHTRIQEIFSSGGPLEDVLRELEVTPEDRKKRSVLIKDVEDLFKERFKGCKALTFGSTYTGLCFKDSDVDVFLVNDGAKEEFVNTTTAALAESLIHAESFTRIRPIASAKIPIIKFIHNPTNLSGDLSFENTRGMASSDLIKHYIALDERVYPYFMLLKYWGRKHGFSGTWNITNYTLSTLAAFYLQQLEQPVLPSVHQLQELSEDKEYIDGWLCSFSKDPNAIEPSRNTSSLFELLAGFFNYYDKLNIGDVVLCPYLGKTVPKMYFLNTEKLPEPLKTIYNERVTISKDLNVFPDLCVQDPFELTRNITSCIRTSAVEDFQICTRAAVEVCQELDTADEKKKLVILGKVFCVIPELGRIPRFILTDLELTLKIFAVGFLSMPFLLEVEKALKIEMKACESKTKWFLIILNLVITFFIKIMKFEVELVEEGAGKKINSSSDLPDPVDTDNPQKYVFYIKSYYNIWDNRKKIHKEMGKSNTLPVSHCLDVEEAVTNEVFKQHCFGTPSSNPIVKFTCEFFCVSNPASVSLTFKNKEIKKGQFPVLITNLSKLPSLIDNYCTYVKENVKERHRKVNKLN